jgi:hypothetical protein
MQRTIILIEPSSWFSALEVWNDDVENYTLHNWKECEGANLVFFLHRNDKNVIEP